MGDEARSMVRKINAEQVDQSAQSRPVLELLTELLDNTEVQGRALTAKERAGQLQDLIPSYDVDLIRKITGNYVAQEIEASVELFIDTLSMVRGIDRHRKTNI